MILGTQRETRRGYVLLSVLIVLVVLSLVAYRFSDSMMGEYRGATQIPEAANARIAAAIADWVDPDDDPGSASGGAASGAESGDYQNYRPKNGPLNSLDELLLVKGVTPQLLYGTDQNQDGVDNDGGTDALSRGWSD